MADEEAFVAQVVHFLDAQGIGRATTEQRGWGEGADDVGVMDDPSHEQELADLERARTFQRALFDAGLADVTAPPELGGRHLPASYRRVVTDTLRAYATPKLDTLLVTLRIFAPALAVHASGELRQSVLPALLRADLVGCQLFSEPEAGSDLAGVRTRAVRDGDEWVVTGQKVWTSSAHFSDVGLLLARTDPDVPKHRGLTMFVADMHDPAVTVRPLRQMTGGAHFNEVFIDGLRIPDSRRVGDVGQGWQVAITTLSGEREAVGDSQEAPATEIVDRLLELCRHRCTTAVQRHEVVRAWELATVHDWTNRRLVQAAAAKGGPGPEMSISKLMHNQVLARTTNAAGHVLGPAMIADTGAWGTYTWARATIAAPGLRIAGGTDEIQRNILGERVLGLPKDPPPPGG